MGSSEPQASSAGRSRLLSGRSASGVPTQYGNAKTNRTYLQRMELATSSALCHELGPIPVVVRFRMPTVGEIESDEGTAALDFDFVVRHSLRVFAIAAGRRCFGWHGLHHSQPAATLDRV